MACPYFYHMLNPEQLAAETSTQATKSLMAHTIRGVQNHFQIHGIALEVLIIWDTQGAIFRGSPNKSSILVMRFIKAEAPYRGRVKTKIFIRRQDSNHHRTRLCIAHELFHALLALDTYIQRRKQEGDKAQWDGIWKKEHEPLCNKFAQELTRLHNEFNQQHHAQKVVFPSEIYKPGFVLDLSDLNSLPDCLRKPD